MGMNGGESESFELIKKFGEINIGLNALKRVIDGGQEKNYAKSLSPNQAKLDLEVWSKLVATLTERAGQK